MTLSNRNERGPRVAILGIHLEASGFARPTTRADFLAECWEEGDAITELARSTSHLPLEVPGFYEQMDATGPWIPVPLIMLAAQPGGPVEEDVFAEFVERAERGLRGALPLDAVYICNHGGSSAIGDDDNDGTVAVLVRSIVGPDIPVVITHDLHCNVSERLVEAVDALISYRTNPHVDHRQRAAEAADLLRAMIGGLRTRKAFMRLPMAPPGVTLLAAKGWPYWDLIQLGQELCKPPILNVSVTAGYVLTDLPKCGMTVNVTSAGDQEAADRVARVIAETAWAQRHRYARELTSVERAVEIAQAASQGRTPPVLLADISDNPGGGAPGNTTWLLRALHDANVHEVVVGLFTDPDLAAEAHRAGKGAHIDAVFNRVESEHSKRFASGATVLELSDGHDVGRRGRDAGRQIVLGTSALLELDGSGIRVAVTSIREQLADPRMLEMFGIDIAQAKCVVGKSRGHFRAGYDEFFKDDQIYEVDSPGLTSAILTNFRFKKLKRPIWPLDPDTTWSLPPEKIPV